MSFLSAMRSDNQHIHHLKDGRGPREYFVNEVKIPDVIYADTQKGYLRAFKVPRQIVNYSPVTIELTGNVRVKYL